MDRLTHDHARRIGGRLRPTLGYLHRLTVRMSQTGLDVRDPKLYRLALAAEHALHALTVELHYQSCASGVGRPLAAGPRPAG